MEIIFELLFEFLLQLVLEVLVDLGVHGVKKARKDSSFRPVLAFIGYGLLGLASGGISLLIYNKPFLRSATMPGIGLIIIPILGGLAMWQLGRFWKRKGQERTGLESFICGAFFAFGMTAVRFMFCR